MDLHFSATSSDFVSLEGLSDQEPVKPVSEPVKPVSQTSRRKTTQPKRRTTKVVAKTETPKPEAVVPKAPKPPKVVAIPSNASVEAAEALADDPTSGVTTKMFREWYESHAVKTPRQRKASVPVSSWETVNGRVKHTLKGEKRATSKAGETIDRVLKRLDPEEFCFVVQQLTAELCGPNTPIVTEIVAGTKGDYERSTCGSVNVPSDENRQKEMFNRLERVQLVAELIQKAGLAS